MLGNREIKLGTGPKQLCHANPKPNPTSNTNPRTLPQNKLNPKINLTSKHTLAQYLTWTKLLSSQVIFDCGILCEETKQMGNNVIAC